MQSLATKLIKFNFSCEVAAHNIFHFLANWRFESVAVDSVAGTNVVVVDFCGAPEKSGNVFFEYCEGGVEIFEDSNYGVLGFDGTFCTLEGAIGVEGTEKWVELRF